MMSKKVVEWRNTNDKPYYKEYHFPLSLTNRCWFFWANTVNGWKKTLNLANALAFGNKISVVFLYGEIKKQTLDKYLVSLHNEQLIVLHADYISAEDIKTVDNADEWLKGLQKSGGRARDENKEWLFDVSEHYLKYTVDYSSNQKYETFLTAKDIAQNIQSSVGQNGYSVLANVQTKRVSGKQESVISDLLSIVKELYPLGIEADTEMEFAYKRVAVPKLIKLGLEKDLDDTLVQKLGIRIEKEQGFAQLSLFDDYSESATEIVNVIQTTCRKDLQTLGHIDQFAVATMLKNRPYGVYECNYYCYLLAYAYSEFTHGYYYGYGLVSHPIERVELNRNNILAPLIFVITPKQKSLITKLCRLFDVTKEIETLQQAVIEAITWITENVHYDTVQRVSSELFELLQDDQYDVYSRITEKYDDYLDDATVTSLYSDLRKIDENFIARANSLYGVEKTKLLCKYLYVKGGARGWLHSIELVDETVEKYMKEIICRECGGIISNYRINPEFAHETIKLIDGKLESRNWTLKQIIGINKKLLGRQQNEYYCIHCLSEMLEMSEMELWEKMHEFKESGCTLF